MSNPDACGECSDQFVSAHRQRAAVWIYDTSRGPARRSGSAYAHASFFDARDIAGTFAQGRRVYAGDDHASRPGSRDDSADGVAYREQRTPIAGRAHQ